MNVAGGCLVVVLTESLTGQAALEFQREVFEESIRRKTKGIILDASDVLVMDSYMGRNLADVCRTGLMLGKKIVVVGLRPAVVASLVDLEIDLSCIHAAVNTEEAMALINPSTADAERLEAKDTPFNEDAELEEDDEDAGDVHETEQSLAE